MCMHGAVVQTTAEKEHSQGVERSSAAESVSGQGMSRTRFKKPAVGSDWRLGCLAALYRAIFLVVGSAGSNSTYTISVATVALVPSTRGTRPDMDVQEITTFWAL